jgi:hypothetical protein
VHVSQLDDHPSPFAVVSLPQFPQGVAKKRPLRLARLIADLTNGVSQQPPGAAPENEQNAVADFACKKAIELFADFCMLRADKQNREEYE